MELEVIRMVSAAAADDTIGINAMIAALPIDGDDERPAAVTIYNAVDDAWVRRRHFPEGNHGLALPAVAILLGSPLDVDEVTTTSRTARFPLQLAYLAREADSAKGARDALYVNRAILRFLRRFADNGAAALRTRNGVQLFHPTETTQGQTSQEWNKAIMTAATLTTWVGRELAA